MASIIEAFKQTETSQASNNSEKLTAILVWNAKGLKKTVADRVFGTWIRQEFNLDLVIESLHEKLSSAFGLYRQWLWLQAIFGDDLYKQNLSDTKLISKPTREVIDRELNSEYYFDVDQYMATVYDDFVADVRQADKLYYEANDSAAAADMLALELQAADLLGVSVEKYFHTLLLNPQLYVRYGFYIDSRHYEFAIDVNKVGFDSSTIPVPTTVPVGSILTGKRRGLFY